MILANLQSFIGKNILLPNNNLQIILKHPYTFITKNIKEFKMNKTLLTSLLTLSLSTSLHASAHDDSNHDISDMLAHAPQNYVTFYAEGRTLSERGEDSLFDEIERYMGDPLNSNSTPVHIYMGEDNVKDVHAFSAFFVSLFHLNKTPIKDLTLTVDPSINDNVNVIYPSIGGLKLTSCTLKGFQKLDALSNHIFCNSDLTSFSVQECPNLEYIGRGFLSNNYFSFFCAEGLESVKTLGAGFLSSNSRLSKVDLRAFRNLTSIEGGFLGGCPIEEVIVANKSQQEFFEPHILRDNPNAKFIIK